MRTINSLLVLVSFLTISCENNGNVLSDGFCIKFDNSVVLDHNDIEYYDYSTHLIYLKNSNSFLENINGINTFTVYADWSEIYSGQLLPMYSSFWPSEPVIRCPPFYYGDYIIPIEFTQMIDSLGNANPDPREDARIIEALQKYSQYHSGLSCEINSVQYSAQNNVTIELELRNEDTFSYYYLDPDKMGVNLFHYFTNGLYIMDFANRESFTHKIEIIHPEPWGTWEKDWLSLIRSNESKTITIRYDSFEIVTTGQYKATFTFPGLGGQVEKEDIQQDGGRIWLGKLDISKNVMIE